MIISFFCYSILAVKLMISQQGDICSIENSNSIALIVKPFIGSTSIIFILLIFILLLNNNLPFQTGYCGKYIKNHGYITVKGVATS